tara:strand:- start:417 stop:662 length:246 start_codon:yes stop_codon:yes gene_type:complete
MATEITDQEPVLVLNEKKYIINDLSDEAKSCIVQLQNVQQQMNQTTATFEQLQMAFNGFNERLAGLVEGDNIEPVEEPTVN